MVHRVAKRGRGRRGRVDTVFDSTTSKLKYAQTWLARTTYARTKSIHICIRFNFCIRVVALVEQGPTQQPHQSIASLLSPCVPAVGQPARMWWSSQGSGSGKKQRVVCWYLCRPTQCVLNASRPLSAVFLVSSVGCCSAGTRRWPAAGSGRRAAAGRRWPAAGSGRRAAAGSTQPTATESGRETGGGAGTCCRPDA